MGGDVGKEADRPVLRWKTRKAVHLLQTGNPAGLHCEAGGAQVPPMATADLRRSPHMCTCALTQDTNGPVRRAALSPQEETQAYL